MDEAREAAASPVSPRQVALTYDRVVSAHWRGETDTATALDEWFEAHWSEQAPPEPDVPPEGTSVLGGSGGGIRWYTSDGAVLGYVSRRPDGCYRVPMREAVPELMASWDILELEATRQPETDRLLHHMGANLLPAQSTTDRVATSLSRDPAYPDPVRGQHSKALVAVRVIGNPASGNSSGAAASS